MNPVNELSKRFLALSTPEVSDALEIFGVVSGLLGIRPVSSRRKLFGPAFTVAKEVNDRPEIRQAADFVDDIPPGHVVVIDNLGLETSTCWGGILTLYAQKKGLAGTFIHGLHRDADLIRTVDYPVFSRGSFMVTGKGRTRLKAIDVPLDIGGVRITPGDYILADENGGVVIPPVLTEQVLERAEAIHAVEEEICNLALEQGVPLVEARKRLGYHDLTRPLALG
jgi:regulator of RNase E activity RraA